MNLHLVGTWKDRRRLIRIDDKDVWLRPKSFRYLFLMAAKGGWVESDDFEISLFVGRHIYRLNKEIQIEGLIDNDRAGRYRLSSKVTAVCIEKTEELINDEDCEIRNYFN